MRKQYNSLIAKRRHRPLRSTAVVNILSRRGRITTLLGFDAARWDCQPSALSARCSVLTGSAKVEVKDRCHARLSLPRL